MDATAAFPADIDVIDADTHVIEPPDLWTSRVSVRRWADKVPHVVWDDRMQAEMWVTGDTALLPASRVAAAGTEGGQGPDRFEEVPPEVWRAEDRLRLMTEHGIHAQVLYPNVSGFGAGNFAMAASSDADLALELIKAYNDYLVDFSSADSTRFVPVMGVPFWDIDLSIAEMERSAANGHRGIIFSQQPEHFGQPALGERHWDRLWAAAQEMQLPVNFHIGGGAFDIIVLPADAGRRANNASAAATTFMGNCRAIMVLIGSGVCHRFPDLKIVSVESGIGWIAFALQAYDWMWAEGHVRAEHPEYDLLPSEYFRRQIYGCFWFEQGKTLEAAIDYLGDANILYETDFPHPASMWPGPASSAPTPRDFITQNLHSLGEATLRKVLHDNAAALYRL